MKKWSDRDMMEAFAAGSQGEMPFSMWMVYKHARGMEAAEMRKRGAKK